MQLPRESRGGEQHSSGLASGALGLGPEEKEEESTEEPGSPE